MELAPHSDSTGLKWADNANTLYREIQPEGITEARLPVPTLEARLQGWTLTELRSGAGKAFTYSLSSILQTLYYLGLILQTVKGQVYQTLAKERFLGQRWDSGL